MDLVSAVAGAIGGVVVAATNFVWTFFRERRVTEREDAKARRESYQAWAVAIDVAANHAAEHALRGAAAAPADWPAATASVVAALASTSTSVRLLEPDPSIREAIQKLTHRARGIATANRLPGGYVADMLDGSLYPQLVYELRNDCAALIERVAQTAHGLPVTTTAPALTRQKEDGSAVPALPAPGVTSAALMPTTPTEKQSVPVSVKTPK